jgi:hypothetical protein
MCGYSVVFVMQNRALGGHCDLYKVTRIEPGMPGKTKKSPKNSLDETGQQRAIVKQLVALIGGGQAHASFADAVKGFPAKMRGEVPAKLPYSGWQLLEHLRIAQRDILEFSTNFDGTYKHRKWPDEYWPKDKTPPNAKAWDASIAAIEADRKEFAKLLTAKNADLYTPFPWGTGQNLLREALLIADHDAYHIGELVVLRRLLGCWK